jgi:hypothetical protein
MPNANTTAGITMRAFERLRRDGVVGGGWGCHSRAIGGNAGSGALGALGAAGNPGTAAGGRDGPGAAKRGAAAGGALGAAIGTALVNCATGSPQCVQLSPSPNRR